MRQAQTTPEPIAISTTLADAIGRYLRANRLSRGTCNEYGSTLRKWRTWPGHVALEVLGRREISDFLEWVYDRAVERGGANPGRTANKAHEHLHAVLSWACEREIINSVPVFPKLRTQRDVAGRHYLTKSEINALYFATYAMKNPRGWRRSFPLGQYWRCALVMFFNYGLDTGTIWKCEACHEPLLWRHISWRRQSPDREVNQRSRWGWLYYRRVKTGRTFHRPMNHVVHAHIKSIMPADPDPDQPVFYGGGGRPPLRFQQLCQLAGVRPKTDIASGEARPWVLKDLRKTCATYYDEHVPESSVEILGHSAGGVTYRHYAHRAPLAFRSIMTLPQPSAFAALAKGFDGQCPCCRRRFAESEF